MAQPFAFSNDPYDVELDALKRRYELANEITNNQKVSPLLRGVLGMFQRPKTQEIEQEFRDLQSRRQTDRQADMDKLAEIMAGPKRETPYVPATMPQMDDNGEAMPGSFPRAMANNQQNQSAFGDKRARLAQELLMSKFPDIQAQGMKMAERPAPKLNWQRTGNELIAFDESTGQPVNRMPLGESPDNYANRNNISLNSLYTHGTESGNNIANRTSISANQRAQLMESIAKMRDQGIDTRLIEQGLGLSQPTPQQTAPQGIPPEVLAAAQGGQPFHMTQAPGQAPVNQPLPPQLSPETQRKVAAEEAKLRAANLIKAQVALPDMETTANTTLKHLGDLLKHPGMKDVVGAPDNPLKMKGYVLPTEAKDFRQRHNQLVGETFLEAYKTLKGGGQITEIEGEKATAALNRMNTSSRESDYRAAANDFKEIVQNALNNARIAAGKPPLKFDATNQASGAVKRGLSIEDRLKKY